MKIIHHPTLGKDLELLPIKNDGVRFYIEYFGNVNAGFPSPAADFTGERISIDEKYLNKIESTLMVRVGGDSMYPNYQLGDILILRTDYQVLHLDDAVVSINNSEYTLKRIDTQNKALLSLNPNYNNCVKIDPEDVLIVLGVVDAIIRDVGRKRR